MRNAGAPDGRYTVEIPVHFTPGVERAALARLREAQRLSNDVLAVFLARAANYRRDRDLARLRAERVTAIAEGRLPASPRITKKVAARRAKPVPIEVVPRHFVFETAAARARAWQDLRERHGLFGKSTASFSDAGRAWYEADQVWVKSLTAAQHALGVRGLGAEIIHHEIVAAARERVMRWIAGETGRPRFASRRHPRESISGSSSAKNKGSLRVDVAAGVVRWAAARGKEDLFGALLVDEGDVYLRKSPRKPICQVRLLFRTVRGKRRWFAQLVVAGTPPVKPTHRVDPARAGVVGVDLGVQHYAAVVVDAGAVSATWIEDLAPTAAERERLRDRGIAEKDDARKRDRYVRRLQRIASKKMRRNPTNAHAIATRKKTLVRTRDGRAVGKVVDVEAGIRKRARIVKSAAVRGALAKVAEIRRADAVARDVDHGRAANRILAGGAIVALEDLSYVAWQRVHGRSTMRRGAGGLVARLRRRAPLFNATIVDLPASLKLSQLCHLCGTFTPQKAELRKPIARRTSTCGCGREDVQRDVYSAFLVAFAAGETHVDTRAAQAAWAGSWEILESARRVYESGRLTSSVDDVAGAPCARRAPGRLSTSTIARQGEVQRLRSTLPSKPRVIDGVEHLGGERPPLDRSTSNRRHDAAHSPSLVEVRMQGRGHPLESRAENADAIRSG